MLGRRASDAARAGPGSYQSSTDYAPYCIPIDPELAQRLDEHFGSNPWRAAIVNHVVTVGADAGREELGGGLWRDKFAVVWRQGAEPSVV